MNPNYSITENAERKRYELEAEGKTAYVEYIKVEKQNKIYLTHTEVPRGLEGKGIGSALVKLVLEEVEKGAWELIPLCPFVAMYIKKHPEWKKLVFRGVNIG